MTKWYVDVKGHQLVFLETKIRTGVYDDIIDINTRKLATYLANKNILTPSLTFRPTAPLTFDEFITIIRRLGIINSLADCSRRRLCDAEMTRISPRNKGVYLRIISRMTNPKLRTVWTKPDQYIANNYKPLLAPSYRFPLTPQTLNGCVFFATRNIMTYKRGIGLHIRQIELAIGKDPKKLTDNTMEAKFNKLIHIIQTPKYQIQSLFTHLQAGDPVMVSYILAYTGSDKKLHYVGHVVAAYSFDEVGVRVSETVSNKRLRIPYDQLFTANGTKKQKYMRALTYNPLAYWTADEKEVEKKGNFMKGEW